MAKKKLQTNLSSQHETRLTKAISNIILDSPFFGSLIIQMPLEASEECDTMATNGKKIIYNIGFVEKLSDSELKGVLVHEIMHPAMAHHARRGDRDPDGWNEACDYAINPIIKESKFQLPTTHLDEPQYHGMSAEEIYDKLPKCPSSGGSGWNFGQVLDGGDDAQTEIDEWKQKVASAAAAAKLMGDLPAHLERFVDQYLESKLPWQEILARFMHAVTKNDFNWARPNKALLVNYGLYLPTLHSDACGSVVVAIDTSGSIGQPQLDEFGAELNGILDQVRPEKTTVIYCDADVQHVDEFTPDQYPVTLNARGGGGTDFRPVFDYSCG